MPHRTLDPDQIIARIERLGERIEERFGDRNIRLVCAELERVAKETQARIAAVQTPIPWLRWSVATVIVVLVVAVVATVRALPLTATGGLDLVDLVQTVDAVFNEVVLIGAAMVFLVRTERRVKQQRTLKALHELRSLAHVVDEHQLDKDPDRVLGHYVPTASSPRVGLTTAETLRYLNFCSEMLSSIGKLAALYVQHFDDAVAVAAVTEVEELTLGLSAKIWQKIAIFQAHDAR